MLSPYFQLLFGEIIIFTIPILYHPKSHIDCQIRFFISQMINQIDLLQLGNISRILLLSQQSSENSISFISPPSPHFYQLEQKQIPTVTKVMIINQKTSQPLAQKLSGPIKNKNHSMKNSRSSRLPLKLIKFKKPKKYFFLKETNTQEESKNQQNTLFKKVIEEQQILNPMIKIQSRNSDSRKSSYDQETRETFKEFIKKIQTQNKHNLIKQIINKHGENQHYQSALVTQPLILVSKIPQNTIESYVSAYSLNSALNEQKEKQKNLQILHQNDKKRKFAIHESMNKSFYDRSYRRSKTEKQIKLQKYEFKDNRLFLRSGYKGQKQIDSKNAEDLIISTKNNDKSLKLISIQLMQQQKTLEHPNKTLESHSKSQQNVQNNISFQSLINKRNIKQKDLSKHKKLLQTRFSKIRVRLGSSLYNKNLWTIDSRNFGSKEKLNQIFQIISSEQLNRTFHKDGQSKNSFNSLFCQNKIDEAQNSFIQKRRLLPTAELKSHSDMSKTRKQFFTASRSLRRYKTDDFEKQISINKSENINGWQINEDGPTNYRIQQFD